MQLLSFNQFIWWFTLRIFIEGCGVITASPGWGHLDHGSASLLGYALPPRGWDALLCTYYLWVWCFHRLPDFLNVLCLDFFTSNNILQLSYLFFLPCLPCLIICWQDVSLRVLFDFLSFSFLVFLQFEFSIEIRSLFSCHKDVFSIPFSDIFTGFTETFIHILFKVL